MAFDRQNGEFGMAAVVRPPVFDKSATRCVATFWVVPSRPKVIVPPNHPGAIEITCGKCLRCLITKRNMHCGRMVAEQVGSAASVMLTLTFGDDGELWQVPGSEVGPMVPASNAAYWKARWKEYWKRARVPWVAFRKALWKRYGQTQYCCAGELGSMRSRLHFHAGVYFGANNKIPDWVNLPGRVERDYLRAVRMGEMDAEGCFMCCGVKAKRQYSVKGKRDEFIAWLPEWPGGYVHIGEMTAQSAGYIAKYCMKPADAAVVRGESSVHNSYATKVFRSHRLGYRYVAELGEQAAEAGLEPMNRYRLPGQKIASGPRAGKSREYPMTRGMRSVCYDAYMRKVGELLRTGAIKSWQAKAEVGSGSIVAEMLEREAQRDPVEGMHKLFNGLAKDRRGQWALPHFDVGPIVKFSLCPDEGVIFRTSRGETFFAWQDHSGRGRDLRIPIENWRELMACKRHGAVRAFGLHPPDSALDVRELVVKSKRKIWKASAVVQLDGGELVAVPDRVVKVHSLPSGPVVWPLRQRAKLDAGTIEKVVRAWATDRQIEAIRRRIARSYQARWWPPGELAAREAKRRAKLTARLEKVLGRSLDYGPIC